MSEAAKRTKTWRAQKQEDGYQPVTVWIPGRIKELAVKLAFQQHHDLSVVVAEGTHLRRDTVIPQWFHASKAAAASDGHAVHC